MGKLGTKNALLVDRTVYSFQGKWQNPRQDVETKIYYFISRPMTLSADYKNGIEQFTPSIEITVCGEHPFANDDKITLHTGETYKIDGITYNYKEHNIAVRDMLKPVIENMVITLK